MKAHVLATQRLISNSFFNGFTTLCRWHDRYWLAYRAAPSHTIVPPGRIVIMTSDDGQRWHEAATLGAPQRDYRDPRWIVADDMLYLMLGAYVPSPHLAMDDLHGLSTMSGDNQIWTVITGTRDGQTWTPLRPILRPNHWGWSAVRLTNRVWVLASYDTGVLESCNTLTLWEGTPSSRWRHRGILYDGGAMDIEDGAFRFSASHPSEPVLYRPTPQTLGCCVRTTTTMLLGTWSPGHAWRWQNTGRWLHPSAIMETPQGWLLAAREIIHTQGQGHTTSGDAATWTDAEAHATLWHLHGNRLTRVAILESGGDCAYAGICAGKRLDNYLVSYYSSHDAPHGLADIYLADIRLHD